MKQEKHSQHKALILPWRQALYDFSEMELRKALNKVCAPDCVFHMCHPFGDLVGTESFINQVILPLSKALPDLERRDYIVMAGCSNHESDWVGTAGYFTGAFCSPWLDIPPTGHQITMRFHEFYRIENDQVVEFQAIWDIPEVMVQADAWPMAPSLGRESLTPAPATSDGIITTPYDFKKAEASKNLVVDMINYMVKHPQEKDPKVMQLPRFWHPKMNWYGPSGIGTCRGITGFRNWHQIPFLNAMPDRGQRDEELISHYFADQNYVGLTGWPNMLQTITCDGWLGIAPSNQKVEIRSLDFWRIEKNQIRENWVLIDLLYLYHQLNVDVFARLREFNKAKNLAPIHYSQDFV